MQLLAWGFKIKLVMNPSTPSPPTLTFICHAYYAFRLWRRPWFNYPHWSWLSRQTIKLSIYVCPVPRARYVYLH
jgi:hypothetical protein